MLSIPLAILGSLAASTGGYPPSRTAFLVSNEAAVDDPKQLFRILFRILAVVCVGLKLATTDRTPTSSSGESAGKPSLEMARLQRKFLIVFWLFKMADWLQGPYFYDVYNSKVINGQPVSTDMVARFFLTGFGTAAALGAWVGRLVDANGRKAGSIAFALFYGLSALSVHSDRLSLLVLGRMAGGVGTALLFSAPEAWLVGEHQRAGIADDWPDWLSGTFGLAYLGDSIVAILAGLLAGSAAGVYGPTAPFALSMVFLALGAAVVLTTWRENTAFTNASAAGATNAINATGAPEVRIVDAWRKILADPRILGVGTIQALFEGAMYIFVIQWPPVMINVFPGKDVPFGAVFSCLMAACMMGSSAFAAITPHLSVEVSTAVMLTLAVGSMAAPALSSGSLPVVVTSFLLFEACVGFYFPAIGTLRSKYVPDTHRGVMMAMFRVPLNVIVVAVMLTMRYLGLRGSLACSATALALALFAAVRLCTAVSEERLLRN